MYKVLIADDEDIIRHGLAGMVSQHPRLEVAALAEDGEIALEKAEEVKPDLMLVDINMPFLNGFEFITEAKKRLPNVMIVIVTGYDDFEFVQKALQIGVTDYILKPIMDETFFALLDKVVERLDGIRKSQKYLTWIENQIEQNRPAMINSFFVHWINGHIDEIEVSERMRYLKIEMPEPYLLTIIHLCDNHDLDCIQRGIDWDDNLLYYGCQNITEEIFSAYTKTICFRTEDGALAVISEELSPETKSTLLQDLIAPIEEYLYVKVEIVQSTGKKRLEFPDVFDAAMEKLRAQRHYSEIVLHAIAYIDEQWRNSQLSLQTAAEKLYITPQHLSRMFNRDTGETFGAYLSRKRLSEAMRLLQDPNLKMYEVAERTGYTSQHYFSSAFKKAMGMSPANYRKNVLRQGNAE